LKQIAAQIIPSDATPGAREAGVVFFIDRALATFFAHIAQRFRSQLSEFHHDCRARYAEVESFASLPNDRQHEWLSSVEHSPFFRSMRQLTLLWMFTMQAYGGNRDDKCWQLLGFEDQHIFAPPFGYYDRDYPGFAIEPSPGK
jgi:gluconate 2-dehydrogenase gamma chain